MAVNADEVYRFSVLGLALGQRVFNVLHAETRKIIVANPVVAQSEQTLLTALRDVWRSAVLPHLWSGYSITRYEVQRIIGKTPDPTPAGAKSKLLMGPVHELAGGAADVGNPVNNTDPLPTYCAVSVRKRTDMAGRSFRGGMRLGPIEENDVTGNTIIAGVQAAIQGTVNQFLAFVAVGAASNLQANWSVFGALAYRKNNQANKFPWEFSGDLTSVTVSPFISSQVSRKQRGSLGA